MASRFPPSASSSTTSSHTHNLQHRDPRSSNSLFDSYPSSSSGGNPSYRAQTSSPSANSIGGAGSYYPPQSAPSPYQNGGPGSVSPGYRPGTPNKKGQYSDSLLSSLESQSDNQLSVLSSKVSQFKAMTVAIGDEIRSSSSLAEGINDQFDNTRVRLKGTWGRMMRMAEKTGVGWRVWVGFFGVVALLFWYVWLF